MGEEKKKKPWPSAEFPQKKKKEEAREMREDCIPDPQIF